MSICHDSLSDVIDQIQRSFAWRCRPLLDDDTARVATGRLLADGDMLDLLVRVADGLIIVSDGGSTLARLEEHGLDRTDPALGALWSEALRQYRLQETDGRVYVETSDDRAAYDLNRFADSLVALDALRVASIPRAVRAETLADEVEEFLRSRFPQERVRRSPRISVAQGLVLRPTFAVDTPSRELLLQTGTLTSKAQAYDHAYTLFNLAARGGVPAESRLTVLGGNSRSWSRSRLEALADISFVGFWQHRNLLEAFITEEARPSGRILVPASDDFATLM